MRQFQNRRLAIRWRRAPQWAEGMTAGAIAQATFETPHSAASQQA
jgi:hypothetical protein